MRRHLLAFLLLPTLAFATQIEHQSVESIAQLAKNYLADAIGSVNQGKVVIEIGQLDPRLKLRKCPKNKLSVYLPPGNKAITARIVGIRCASVTPWSIFVPVQVKIMTRALVAERDLGRGVHLSPNDLRFAEYDMKQLSHGYYQDPRYLVGKIVKRTLKAGRAIGPNDVVMPKIVHRGENVLITAKNKSFKITMRGTALMDGMPGQTIKVRSKSSNRLIDAKVDAPGQVSVNIL